MTTAHAPQRGGRDAAARRIDALGGPSTLATVAALLPAPLSLGAAAIHFAVIGEHFEEFWAFGLFFAITGWFQAWWAVEYSLRSRTRFLWVLGVVVNAGIVATWVVSRAVGLPFGPQPGVPEPVGPPDVVATLLEAVLVGVLVAVAADRNGGSFPRDRRRSRPRLGPTLVAALIALATTLVVIWPRPG